LSSIATSVSFARLCLEQSALHEAAWGVGCSAWVSDAVNVGGGSKHHHHQQQQHDTCSSDINRTPSVGSDVLRTHSADDISVANADDGSDRSCTHKNCIFACIAPGSISGVAAADVIQHLPMQWRALGMGTATAVGDCDSVTYLGSQLGGGGVQLLLDKILTSLKRACAEVGAVGAGEAVVKTHGAIIIVMDDVGLSARAANQMAGYALQAVALAVGDESLAVVVQPFFTSVLLRGGGGGHINAAAALAVQIYNKILVINDKPSPLIPRLDDSQLARCETATLFSAVRQGGVR
jgi:hypothetical protein